MKPVKEALESLGINPLGHLDVYHQVCRNLSWVILLAYLLILYRLGINGYRVPWMHVNQEHVGIIYDLGLLSLRDLMFAAQSILSPLTSGVGLVTSELGELATIKSISLLTAFPLLWYGQADLFIILTRPTGLLAT